jgi:hypothetical protein
MHERREVGASAASTASTASTAAYADVAAALTHVTGSAACASVLTVGTADVRAASFTVAFAAAAGGCAAATWTAIVATPACHGSQRAEQADCAN